MTRLLYRLVSETQGQDLIEYSLLASLVSLVAVGIVVNVGTGVEGVWGGVDNQMAAAAGGGS